MRTRPVSPMCLFFLSPFPVAYVCLSPSFHLQCLQCLGFPRCLLLCRYDRVYGCPCMLLSPRVSTETATSLLLNDSRLEDKGLMLIVHGENPDSQETSVYPGVRCSSCCCCCCCFCCCPIAAAAAAFGAATVRSAERPNCLLVVICVSLCLLFSRIS